MISQFRMKHGMLAVLAALTIACGGSGPAANESASQAAGNEGVDKSNPCALLTPQEVEAAVGLKFVMREIVEENVCTLEFAPSETAAGGSVPAQPPKDDAEAMAKDFTVGATGGTPKITYTIHWEDGETVIAGAKMAGQMMGSGSMTPLSGVGDEAFLGALASVLYVRVGETAVEMDLRLMPEGQERGSKLAQQLAPKLK